MLNVDLDYEFNEAIGSIKESNTKFQAKDRTKLNYGVYYTPKR